MAAGVAVAEAGIGTWRAMVWGAAGAVMAGVGMAARGAGGGGIGDGVGEGGDGGEREKEGEKGDELCHGMLGS